MRGNRRILAGEGPISASWLGIGGGSPDNPENVKSEESWDHPPDNARKTRSVLSRSVDPETVKKIVKILLWVGISVFYLADSLKSGGAKPWTSNPVRKGVVVLVVLVLLWVVTKILRDSVVRPRQAKEEHKPGSNSPIDPA